MKDKTTLHFNKTPEEILRRRERQLTPEQAEYQRQMQELKAARPPLGGAPPVAIPPLDAEPLDNFKGSMAEQASILRDPTSPLSPLYEPQLAMLQNGHPLAPLPDGAATDPSFRRGVGSMYAANQPQIKRPAQQPAQEPAEYDEPYKPRLSQATKEALEELAAFHQKAIKIQESSMSESAKTEKTEKSEKVEETKKEAKSPDKTLMEELQDILGNQQQWNELNNPKRRKEIESRLKPMDIMDIILHGEIRQEVPVRVGDKPLTILLRSASAEEDLAIKRLMFGESGGDRYLLDKLAVMQITLGLVAINGEVLPSHLTEDRKFDEELFRKKYSKVVKFPVQFITDIGIQYQWFDERVRALFVDGGEAVKNS